MSNLRYDIALLQLDGSISASSKVNTVCLPASGSKAQVGAQCYITGRATTTTTMLVIITTVAVTSTTATIILLIMMMKTMEMLIMLLIMMMLMMMTMMMVMMMMTVMMMTMVMTTMVIMMMCDGNGGGPFPQVGAEPSGEAALQAPSSRRCCRSPVTPTANAKMITSYLFTSSQ